MSNEAWNTWSLPGSLTYFGPFDVIKHKIGDFEWKCGLRMNEFLVRVLSEKQVCYVIMQFSLLSDYPGDVYPEIFDIQRWHQISKFCP